MKSLAKTKRNPCYEPAPSEPPESLPIYLPNLGILYSRYVALRPQSTARNEYRIPKKEKGRVIAFL